MWYHIGMTSIRKTRSLRLTTEDIEIIARLKRHYGLASDNEVIRMALRSADRELQQHMAAHPVQQQQSGTPS